MSAMRKAGAGLAVIAAVVATPLAAQERGFYVGASIGQATVKDSCEGLSGSGVSCDDTDTAWRIVGGYRFNRNFSAELGYTNFGKFQASGFGLSDEIKANAFELTGIGSFPVAERFSLFGKIGFYRADVQERTNFGFSADETNTDLTFGFGASFELSRAIALRGEWQRYSDVGGGDIGKADVDVFSLGVIVSF